MATAAEPVLRRPATVVVHLGDPDLRARLAVILDRARDTGEHPDAVAAVILAVLTDAGEPADTETDEDTVVDGPGRVVHVFRTRRYVTDWKQAPAITEVPR